MARILADHVADRFVYGARLDEPGQQQPGLLAARETAATGVTLTRCGLSQERQRGVGGRRAHWKWTLGETAGGRASERAAGDWACLGRAGEFWDESERRCEWMGSGWAQAGICLLAGVLSRAAGQRLLMIKSRRALALITHTPSAHLHRRHGPSRIRQKRLPRRSGCRAHSHHPRQQQHRGRPACTCASAPPASPALQPPRPARTRDARCDEASLPCPPARASSPKAAPSG